MAWPAGNGEMAALLRTHDWGATPLGPADAWPERLKAAVEMVLASPLIATLAVGQERLLIYNDVAAAQYGPRHPAALGRPIAETFADSYDAVRGFYDRVFAGESITVPAQPMAVGGPGSESVYDAFLIPIRNEVGTVIAAHMTGVEIGERIRAERTLRESEERYRAFVTASTDVVYRMSADWRYMRQLDGRGFLADTAEPDETWRERYVLPADRERVDEAIAQAISTKGLFNIEHGVVRADDTPGWTHSRAAPVIDEDGAIVEWLGTASDITDRRAIEASLRESEERLRAAIELLPVGLGIMNVQGKLVLSNPHMQRFLPSNTVPSREAEERRSRWQVWDEHGVPIDPENWPSARALRGERTLPGVEMLYRDDDGGEVWTNVSSIPIRGPADQVIGAAVVVHDVSAFKNTEAALRERERRLQVLVAELQHRVRNILTVVRSVFSRTAQAGEDLEDVVRHFQGRLDALARTQVIVTRTAGGAADLHELIEDELRSVGFGRDDNVVFAGPDVMLPAAIAESVGLALHELTTNALKYGALKYLHATLQVSWKVDLGKQNDSWLRLTWSEQGVPMVPVSPSSGFGRELIEKALPYRTGGKTSLEFRGGGICCEVSLPLQAAGASHA